MNGRTLGSRILVIGGGILMLLGAVDPMEGSLLILPGSGLVALGTVFAKCPRGVRRYWMWVFMLVAVGVGALFGLSALGGIGGTSGRSMWWGVLVLPYPVGWLMAFAGAIFTLIRRFKPKSRWAQGPG